MEKESVRPYERSVNYYETDQMGIAHHSNYFRYFEEARMDFMKQLGLDTGEMEKQGVIIPNVDAYAKYLVRLNFSDRFTVKVTPALFTGVRMKFEYEITSGGKLCATGYTTHCFVSTDMQTIILKRTHPELYRRLSEIFGA